MEWIFASGLGIILALIGIIYNNLDKRVAKMSEEKASQKDVDKLDTGKKDIAVCSVEHKTINEKFNTLFGKMDGQTEILNDVYTKMLLIESHLNGKKIN